MPINKLVPYVFFDGTAEQAIRLYERALGARTETLRRYGEVPSAVEMCAPEDRERVMHAALRVGSAEIMISDYNSKEHATPGASVQLCLDFDDVDDMQKKFDALAASGKIKVALHDTFWGAKFGAIADEFGIHWMFNCMTRAS